MPGPFDSRLTDERLVDYLLGRLSDEESAPLDELSIADEEFAWRLRAVENDLVDVYVRGGLDAPTRERFKTFYLASPRRREKVMFAKGFSGAVERAGARPSTPEPVDEVPGSRVDERRSPPFWWLAAAAAAIAAIAFSAVLMQHREFRQELADAQKTTASLDQRTRDLEQRLADRQAAAVDTAVAPSSSLVTTPAATPPASAAEAPVTAPVELSPETRAPGAVPSVTLPAENTRAAFDLRLESNEFRRYQATLKDPGTDRVLWQSPWMASVPRRDASMVSIALPTNLLKIQHYTFELAGQTAGGRRELVGSYVFEVVPR